MPPETRLDQELKNPQAEPETPLPSMHHTVYGGPHMTMRKVTP